MVWLGERPQQSRLFSRAATRRPRRPTAALPCRPIPTLTAFRSPPTTNRMNTIGATPDTDLHEVLDHIASGKPVDSDLKRRVRERAQQIKKQILAIHGVQNI